MNRVIALCGFVLLLAGCGQQEAPSVDALSANPARLHALKAQCRAGQHDGAFCAQVAQADLPPIPPSFDEPAEEGQAVALSVQEDSP